MNNRGNGIVEMLYFGIFVFVFVTISFYAYMAYKDINLDIQADTSMSNESKIVAQEMETSYPSLFDGLVVLLFSLLWIVIFAASWFSEDHPIVAIILIIIVVFLMIIGGILSNTYDEMQDTPELSGFSTSFPMTHWVMENYLMVNGVLGFFAIALFVSRQGVFG